MQKSLSASIASLPNQPANTPITIKALALAALAKLIGLPVAVAVVVAAGRLQHALRWPVGLLRDRTQAPFDRIARAGRAGIAG